MPRARVKHSAPALRSLAEESANKCQEALRRKAGEGTTCVVCEYAAFTKSSGLYRVFLNAASGTLGSGPPMELLNIKRTR